MSFTDGLATDKELVGVKKRRSQPYIFEKFENELREKRENEGWLLDRQLKNSVRMKRPKPIDEQFEDEVWCLFANLGFTHMNRDRHFVINYGTEGLSTAKQIDVFAADEDFGMIPIEAQSCGTPVIAYGRGGSLETVKEGGTGLFFYEQTVESVIDAVERFEKLETPFDPKIIRNHAETFSEERFKKEIKEFVELKYNEFNHLVK